MKRLIMSGLYPCFCDEAAVRGSKIILTKKIDTFHKPEQLHADMQILKIRNRLFTLDNCVNSPEQSYPKNVFLNCLFFNNRLYGKLGAVDPSVLDYCRESGIETVNVNQGYTRCSALVVGVKGKSGIITADKSIEKALKNNGEEVLLISSGNIRLEGFEYGFIGGSGFCDDGRVFFFGDVQKHPDYEKIKAFCDKNNSNIEILCESEPLTDIGGAVVL